MMNDFEIIRSEIVNSNSFKTKWILGTYDIKKCIYSTTLKAILMVSETDLYILQEERVRCRLIKFPLDNCVFSPKKEIICVWEAFHKQGEIWVITTNAKDIVTFKLKVNNIPVQKENQLLTKKSEASIE
jgi:hypothetical protein